MKTRYPIGTKYKTRGTHPKSYTVTDIHRTYNHAGELVKVRYVVATHEFKGQTVIYTGVWADTIAKGLIK